MTDTLNLKPFPMVHKGDNNHPVKTIQDLLREQGQSIDVDGSFGPKTEAAVREFQRQRGLSQDGVVGPNTWNALVKEVRRGDEGDAVRGVQEEFNFRDPSRLTVDGVFGPATDTAVRAFQQAIGTVEPAVKVDGIVGPLTWRALVGGTSIG